MRSRIKIPEPKIHASRAIVETLLRCDYYESLAKTNREEEFSDVENTRKQCYEALLKNADDILTEQEKVDIQAGKTIKIERDFVKRFTGGRGWELFKIAGPNTTGVLTDQLMRLQGITIGIRFGFQSQLMDAHGTKLATCM